MRAVFDTNTIISAWFWDGIPLEIYLAAENQFGLLTCKNLFEELQEVVHRKKFQPALDRIGKTADDLLAVYQLTCDWVVAAEVSSEDLRDPKDLKFLACAVGGKADYLVSGDKDLLVLQEFESIKIVTATNFLAILQTEHKE